MTVSDTTAAAAATVAATIAPVNRFRIFQVSFPAGINIDRGSESSRIGRFYQKAVRAVNGPHRCGERERARAEDTAKRLGFKGCRRCQGCRGFGSGLNSEVQWVQWVRGGFASLAAVVRVVQRVSAVWPERNHTKNS